MLMVMHFKIVTKKLVAQENRHLCLMLVGCVAQWLERRSLTDELSLASARSVADV